MKAFILILTILINIIACAKKNETRSSSHRGHHHPITQKNQDTVDPSLDINDNIPQLRFKQISMKSHLHEISFSEHQIFSFISSPLNFSSQMEDDFRLPKLYIDKGLIASRDEFKQRNFFDINIKIELFSSTEDITYSSPKVSCYYFGLAQDCSAQIEDNFLVVTLNRADTDLINQDLDYSFLEIKLDDIQIHNNFRTEQLKDLVEALGDVMQLSLLNYPLVQKYYAKNRPDWKEFITSIFFPATTYSISNSLVELNDDKLLLKNHHGNSQQWNVVSPSERYKILSPRFLNLSTNTLTRTIKDESNSVLLEIPEGIFSIIDIQIEQKIFETIKKKRRVNCRRKHICISDFKVPHVISNHALPSYQIANLLQVKLQGEWLDLTQAMSKGVYLYQQKIVIRGNGLPIEFRIKRRRERSLSIGELTRKEVDTTQLRNRHLTPENVPITHPSVRLHTINNTRQVFNDETTIQFN